MHGAVSGEVINLSSAFQSVSPLSSYTFKAFFPFSWYNLSNMLKLQDNTLLFSVALMRILDLLEM